MNILIAPNAFKGSLSASRAAWIIRQSLPSDWTTQLCPIADGGDGTLDCLVSASGGKYFDAFVDGPLPSMKVKARWGTLGSSPTAVIETAEVAGLRLLRSEQLSACYAHTFGVGQLILKVMDEGFRKIVIGLGGSATNDGGAACLEALGLRLLNFASKPLAHGGVHLRELEKVDPSGIDGRLMQTEILCLSDVNNLLVGPAGATRTFGRQKGATNEELELLEQAMSHYAAIVTKETGVEIAHIPGGGAAGGLGAGLAAFCNARIVPGIDYILRLLDFDTVLLDCDVVITGEGCIDDQTIRGKGIAGIATRAKTAKKPIRVFAGRVKGNGEKLCRQLGVDSIHEISPALMSDAEAIMRAEELLGASVRLAAHLW